MKIFVIILTFNSEQYLPELLDSLNNTVVPEGVQVDFVFVDNGSIDGTREILKHPPAGRAGVQDDGKGIVLLQDTNLGFCGGNNVGMKYAIEHGSDYVVLLNHDTVVEPDWIEWLVDAVQEKSDAGAVQSLLLYNQDRTMVNSWGNNIHFLGLAFAGGNLEEITKYKSQITNIREITYASGAAVMYNVEALKEVGLLDETLESYHEDTDIGMRLRLAGYVSYIAPQSVVYHKYEFLKANKSLKGQYKYYLMERNRIYFVLKYYLPRTLILILPGLIIMEAGIFAFSLLRGFWKEKLRAYGWIVKNWSLIMQARKEIRKKRTITDKKLMHDFVAVVDFQEIQNPVLKYIANPIISLYWRVVYKLI